MDKHSKLDLSYFFVLYSLFFRYAADADSSQYFQQLSAQLENTFNLHAVWIYHYIDKENT